MNKELGTVLGRRLMRLCNVGPKGEAEDFVTGCIVLSKILRLAHSYWSVRLLSMRHTNKHQCAVSPIPAIPAAHFRSRPNQRATGRPGERVHRVVRLIHS